MTPQPLPLAAGARSCIHSGFCCRQAPCPFGTWDAERRQCVHLTADNLCGIYHQIMQSPGWEVAPAFGAGCCSPLNPVRLAMLAKRRAGS